MNYSGYDDQYTHTITSEVVGMEDMGELTVNFEDVMDSVRKNTSVSELYRLSSPMWNVEAVEDFYRSANGDETYISNYEFIRNAVPYRA